MPRFGAAASHVFNDLSNREFLKIAASHVEALNHALENMPQDRVRVHICWGNYEGPHVRDIGMDKVFDALMSSKTRYVLLETSNPRHAHEWTVFRDRKADIADDKILVPGVVDTTTNFVEQPEVVAQRIERFTGIVGKDRVIAWSGCGIGTFAGFGAVDPEIGYAKLASNRWWRDRPSPALGLCICWTLISRLRDGHDRGPRCRGTCGPPRYCGDPG